MMKAKFKEDKGKFKKGKLYQVTEFHLIYCKIKSDDGYIYEVPLSDFVMVEDFKKEINLQKSIELECGKLGWVCFHFNPGKKQLVDATWWNSGIPKGWPDLIIFTDFGLTFFVETKIKYNKPSKEQKTFKRVLNSKQHIVENIYSYDEWTQLADNIIKLHHNE